MVTKVKDESPVVHIRIKPNVHAKAKKVADDLGISVTDVMKIALAEYVKKGSA